MRDARASVCGGQVRGFQDGAGRDLGSPQLDSIRSAVSQKLGPLHLEPGKAWGSRDHRSL